MDTVFVILGCVALLFFFWRIYQARNPHPYQEGVVGYYKEFPFTYIFPARTPSLFAVEYKLSGWIERVNDAEFKDARMLDESARGKLIADYNNEVLLPFLKRESVFFCCRWLHMNICGVMHLLQRVRFSQVIQVDGRQANGLVSPVDVLKAVRKIEFIKNGCKVKLQWINTGIWTNRLVEENFNMITTQRVQEIERNQEFIAYEEAMAVVTMKRQLEIWQCRLRDEADQTHETSAVLIKTERMGGNVRIAWKLKCGEQSGWDLMGFRKEDGFDLDQWSETSNGRLVIHSPCNGSIVENLEEGRAYYYTLFLRAWKSEKGKASSIRFQLQIPKVSELQEIEQTLSRIEARDKQVRALEVNQTKLSPSQEKLNKAMEEIGAYAALEDAFEGVEKKLLAKIENENYSSNEKADKRERLQGFMESIREKYL